MRCESEDLSVVETMILLPVQDWRYAKGVLLCAVFESFRGAYELAFLQQPRSFVADL